MQQVAVDTCGWAQTNWSPTGIDPDSLGVRREEDPEGYLRAYRAAYANLKRAGKPPRVPLTEGQKRDRYLKRLEETNRKNRLAAAERKLARGPKPPRPEKAKTPESTQKEREKRRVSRKKHPEKVAERRIKKVKWSDWAPFAHFYAEARRLSTVTGRRWDVEHIYPVFSDWVCGLHTPDNLRVATRRENARKSNRPFGPCADELWDPDSYVVYWPGEDKTLSQKKEIATSEARRLEREARARERAAERERLRPQRQAAAAQRQLERAQKLAAFRATNPPKRPGRKPMTMEQAIRRPDVQALLSGASIREVVREFGISAVDVVRYARTVDPCYRSPFSKHGRPQRGQRYVADKATVVAAALAEATQKVVDGVYPSCLAAHKDYPNISLSTLTARVRKARVAKGLPIGRQGKAQTPSPVQTIPQTHQDLEERLGFKVQIK